MALIPEKHVWILNGGRQFPGGVFTTVELAEAWDRRYRLSGVLTAYPLDEGCFQSAMRHGVTNLKAEKLASKNADPEFIGGFSTASQEHFHYTDGIRS